MCSEIVSKVRCRMKRKIFLSGQLQSFHDCDCYFWHIKDNIGYNLLLHHNKFIRIAKFIIAKCGLSNNKCDAAAT